MGEPAHFEDDPAAETATALVGQPRPKRIDFDAHEWSVLLPLSLVGFFTNYDTGLLTLAAPDIAKGLGVSVATFGIGVAVIRLAALGSIASLRLADRWGRRRMLLLSVAGFTAATGATAAAWGLIAFVAFQLVARVFLATEETLAGVVLTEELRPDRRGAGIGLLGFISSAGFVLVVTVTLFIDATPLGWRLFYVVALVPLAVVAYLRRNLKETRAFDVAAAAERVQPKWWPKLERVDRSRLWRLVVLLGFVGMLNTTAFFYAANLAQDDYGWKGLFSIIVVASAPTVLAGYTIGGRLSDRFGRKPVTIWSVLVFGGGALMVFTEVRALYAPGFFLLAGADAAIQSVKTAYVSELFPTEVRATLASFIGAVSVCAGSLGLVVVGLLAGFIDTSASLALMAVACTATVLVIRRLPETVGIDVIGPAED
ncbi:MAG TPA: MFS transporter [Acidimicrobiales bacterium]|nr:MFS transporter [Acidimicrobiales bacterium]